MSGTRPRGSGWLIVGGVLSAVASALHLAIIAGGPDWYRFFGAGERVARNAELGSPLPTLMAIGIAAVLAGWAAYAFSGARLLPRLPLLRWALLAIAAIYLLRALLFIPARLVIGEGVDAFAVWSSLIVLVYGLAYALGTWRVWPELTQRPTG